VNDKNKALATSTIKYRYVDKAGEMHPWEALMSPALRRCPQPQMAEALMMTTTMTEQGAEDCNH
jgi:hypothetical protein